MNELAPLLAIAGATAITPGPNNIFVMSAAAKDGVCSLMPMLIGIALTAGGMVFLAASVLGPWLGDNALRLIEAAGALTLAGLSVVAWQRAGTGWQNDNAPTLTGGRILALQALNPKAWVFALTMAAAIHTAALSIWTVAPLVSLISALCLLLWALGGVLIARELRTQTARKYFDRGMATILLFFAGGLAVSGLGAIL
jgi:threonine/homoserine/homoserine lactone efflux protein